MDDPNVIFYLTWLFTLCIIILFAVVGILCYFKFSKKFDGFGYRTKQSQKSLKHWQYANRLAGQILIIYSFVAFDIAFIVFIIQMLMPKPHNLIIPVIMCLVIAVSVIFFVYPITEKKIASNKKLNEE